MFDLTWYNTLNQPPLTPPAAVFAPAWTILYLTIFVSFILYSVKKSSENKIWGYIIFFTQLALNLCWSPLFFIYHNIGMALAVLVIMDILVLITIFEFLKVSKTAGWLLIPYLLWIIFATYLNAGIFILN